VSKRTRLFAYGSAVILVVAGTACAAAVGGVTGQILTMALIGSGLVILTGLVFMEVGLSEDREREREARNATPSPPRRRLEPTRMPRVRGHRHER
jgi:cytochrome c biogenesis protein CcdA